MSPFETNYEGARPFSTRNCCNGRERHEARPAPGAGNSALHRVAIAASKCADRTRRSVPRDLDRPDVWPRDDSAWGPIHASAFAYAHLLAALRGGAVLRH